MRFYGVLLAVAGFSLAVAPAEAKHMRASAHGHMAMGSWEGRWAGSWGGNDPTAIIIKGGRVVAYEYGGSTTPVSSSRVSATLVSYKGDGDVTVTMKRTGAKSAHATIHSSRGDGTAEMTRQ